MAAPGIGMWIFVDIAAEIRNYPQNSKESR
jgi:hypothetical protein